MGYGNVINIINYLLYVYIPNRAPTSFGTIREYWCRWMFMEKDTSRPNNYLLIIDE